MGLCFGNKFLAQKLTFNIEAQNIMFPDIVVHCSSLQSSLLTLFSLGGVGEGGGGMEAQSARTAVEHS